MHSISHARNGAQPPSCCNCVTFSANLRTYIELNRFCIAEGHSAAYRIWLLCRGLDPEGRGIVSLDVLLPAMEAYGLNRHHLRRLRKASGSSSFLAFHAHHIEYRSLEAVCLSLGVLPGQSVFIPTESICSTESFRAALYTAWIAGQDSLLISRERLESLFNVSAHTQRRWERLTGVEVTHNVIEVAKSDLEAAEAHIPKDARLDGDRLGRSYVWEYQGSFYYQSVNSYNAPHYARGRVGNVRKVSRAVRHALVRDVVKPVLDHGDGTRRRIFYTERTTPTNHQEQTGCSIREEGRPVDVPHGLSDLWRFSQTRPVARREVFC